MIKKVFLFTWVIALYNFTFSQTGPGGIGNSATNGLWLKADDISLANNAPIVTWSDFSGNSNNASAVITEQPLFISSSAMNNMPAARFDGNNDIMTIADAAILDGSSGLTFFAVIRPNNLDNSPRPILGKRDAFTGSDYAYTWFFFSGNYLNMDINTANNRFNTNPTSFSNATNYILKLEFDGSLASGVRSKISNGGSVITTSSETSSSVLNSTQDLILGTLNAGDGRELGGDYAEIIHYNLALNSAQSIVVHNYLSAKYDIALTSNNIYDEDDNINGDYDYEVAGIGQVDGSNIHDDAQGSGIVRILSPNDLGNNEFLIWGHNNGNLNSTGVADLPPTILSRIARDWSASEIGEVGNTTIRFDLGSVPGAITVSDLRLLIDADGVYSAGASIHGPPTDLGGNIYEWTGIDIDDNDHFTIGSINASQTPLPIELLNFTARPIGNEHVQLNWQTASEINNDFFTIESSTDRQDWQELDKIDGAGNSNSLLSYSVVDYTSFDGVSYYRLKQTDFDGQFEYSQIKSVNIQQPVNTQIEIYPNPTTNQIIVTGNSNELEEFVLYNTLGQNMTSLINQVMTNETQLVIDMSKLNTGVYYMKTKTTANRVYKQ